jgi:prepilin-type N-terminal cleavage/methylation domain-containing protein
MHNQNFFASSRGFTLIELMITIAIVSILVALAVPAYKDYSVRSKVAECINNAAVPKVQVSEYRQVLGAWPPSAADAGINVTGDSGFCDGMVDYQPSSGAFHMDIDEDMVGINSGIVQPAFTPTLDGSGSGMINWDCGPGTTTAGNLKYLPGICRES